MDNNLTVWTVDRANDILKAAHELQTLCSTSRGCVGCPFQTGSDGCVFICKPVVPWEWHIQEKTVYTVELPQD